MENIIEKNDATNYCRFDDMVYRRESEYDRISSDSQVSACT